MIFFIDAGIGLVLLSLLYGYIYIPRRSWRKKDK